MKKFKAKIKMPNGQQIDVVIDAKNSSDAKALLEAQYGKGNVFTVMSA